VLAERCLPRELRFRLGYQRQLEPDEDKYMEEMGDHARIWHIYNEEAAQIDAEMVNGWKGSLDTLLLFVCAIHPSILEAP
jgi:hypothetical protein